MSSVSIVMYHYVRDLKNGKFNNIKGLDIALFKEQLDFFKRNYCVIKMEDLIYSVESKKQLPKNALLLTFDDGYIDHSENVLPLLEKYNMQGSFFPPAQNFYEKKLLNVNKVHFALASCPIESIYIDTLKEIDYQRKQGHNIPKSETLVQKYALPNRFDDAKTIFVKRALQTILPEKIRDIIADKLFGKYVGEQTEVFAQQLYMQKNHLKDLKNAGMFIGLHSYNHCWLGHLNKEAQEIELKKALFAMKEFIDIDNWVMNYPYGSYNKETIEILEKLNCKLALTTSVDVCDLSVHNKFELPRLDTVDFPPVSNNYLKYEKKVLHELSI